MSATAIIIPARYASTRLPGKPLADIGGTPMILHVLQRALRVRHVDRVVVATDDARIARVVREAGGDVLMTSTNCSCGTARVLEAMDGVPADVYVNLQSDEPFVEPAHVEAVLEAMRADPTCMVGTLCHPVSAELAVQPHIVKVVMSDSGKALYFSRAAIPHIGHGGVHPVYFKHLGVYAYRAQALRLFQSLPPCLPEQVEQLEQLRLLHAGVDIQCVVVAAARPGVDTPACLEAARQWFSQHPDIS